MRGEHYRPSGSGHTHREKSMATPRWIVLSGLLLLALAAPVSAGWSPLGGPIEPILELQLDPGRPGLLYARVIVTEGREQSYLWRSKDRGATWHDVQSGLEHPASALAIDPSDPKVIWVWTADGELWRSGDAGETWSRRFATPPTGIMPDVRQLLVDPRNPATIYRVDNGTEVAVSRNGGASFRKGGFVPNFSGLDGIFVHAERDELLSFDERGLEVSTNDGRTWSVRGRYRGQGFVTGRLAPSAPDTLYGLPFSSSACLVRSDDAGAHWQALAYP